MKLKRLFCLAAILAFGCSVSSEKSAFKEDLKLITLQGNEFDLSKFDDQYLLVNFWATWCKPCIREMPLLNDLNEALNDQNIKFIYISNEDPDHVSEFLKRQNLDIESFIMPDAIEVYELLYLPTTFIVSPDGDILLKKEGEQDWSGTRMKQEITDLISE